MRLLAKYRASKVFNEEILYHHDECTGNTGNLYVRYCYSKGKLGWKYHCHSCGGRADGLSGFFPDSKEVAPTETLSQLEVLFKEKTGVVSQVVELPEDFTTELPTQALGYMLKYGLTQEEILLSRYGWSSEMDRLIMPVYDGDTLIYWQGRNLGKVTAKNPKYRNMYKAGCRDVFATFHRRDKGQGVVPDKTLVVVEAIISALKLSRHVDCLAILGSYFSSSLLAHINAHDYTHVIIWLDPDKHMTVIDNVGRLTALTGRPCIACLTDKKPKDYSDKEIVEWINTVV